MSDESSKGEYARQALPPINTSIIGKFYLWLNSASALNYYWNREGACWTTDPHNATMLDTEIEAKVLAVIAQQHTKAEVIVSQARRELTPRQPESLHYEDAIDMMERTGGAFARAIAQAYHCADFSNRKRLFEAFNDLFDSYTKQFMEWKESK